jgi:prepilin-type N-terminal cleavage/methylation domain-containing protein
MKIQSKQAFSLVEFSIVIIIVGVVIAAVSQSSRLLSKSELATAQRLTQSSPVAGMESLILWLETTTPESFGSSSLPDDSSKVANWHDINPQSSTKNNAQQENTENQPLFISECIGGLPCIRFDRGANASTGDFLVSDADIGFRNKNLTFFVVISKIGGYDAREFIFGNGSRSLSFSEGDLYLVTGFFGIGRYFAANNDLKIISITIKDDSPTDDSSMFMNGSQLGPNFSSASRVEGGLLAIGAPDDGQHSFSYTFSGNIFEIIIFDRALKNEERQEIESYLSKKWKVALGS